MNKIERINEVIESFEVSYRLLSPKGGILIEHGEFGINSYKWILKWVKDFNSPWGIFSSDRKIEIFYYEIDGTIEVAFNERDLEFNINADDDFKYYKKSIDESRATGYRDVRIYVKNQTKLKKLFTRLDKYLTR